MTTSSAGSERVGETSEMDRLLAGYAPPMAADVAALEAEVYDQLRHAGETRLRLLGYGSFSIAMAHPKAAPRWALKRLPPADAARAARYQAHIERYVTLLQGLGVRVVASSLHAVAAKTGGVALYIAQPILPPETLLPNVLRARTPSDTDAALVGVVEAIRRGATRAVGIDGNFGNWAWLDGEPWCFDISTPFTKGPGGKPELEVTLMLKPYLVFARPYLRWFVAPKLLEQYHDFRHTVREAIGLLQIENLHAWMPAAVVAANRLLDRPMTVEEARSAHNEERDLDELAYRMRLGQRWLVRALGGTYQFLMPPPPVRGSAADEKA
jgi:hypothetical protein